MHIQSRPLALTALSMLFAALTVVLPMSNAGADEPPPTRPSAPAAPTATAGNAEAVINWTEPSMGSGTFTEYRVALGGGAAACAPVTDVSVTTCTATGLTNGKAYRFKVRAVSSVGVGPWSELSEPVTPKAPRPPSAAAAPSAIAGNAEATVYWDPPSVRGTGTFTRYDLATADDTVVCVSEKIKVRSCKITGLTNGATYRYKVRSVTSAGEGAWSALSNAAKPAAPPQLLPTKAGAPSAPNATAGDAQATITWSGPHARGNGTFFGYEVAAADGTVVCVSTALNTRTCTAKGLTNGAAYQFKVRMMTSAGAGAYSVLSATVVPDGDDDSEDDSDDA